MPEDPSATLISERAAPAPTDVLEKIRAIAGVTAVTESPPPSDVMGARFFTITFEQPVDHRAPRGARFSQKLTLLYRSAEAPTVMGTTGYFLDDHFRLSEPAYALQANQLDVEHRYYGSSVPQPLDWQYLDIYQSASDHHRVYQAFRKIMPKRWAAVGGSKGGMSAVYYRFFYPRDMAAAVPYSTPVTHGVADPIYNHFLAKVGTAECRDKLHALQRALLQHRTEMEKRMTDEATSQMDSYNLVGLDRSFDFAVLETPFTFWQYIGSSGCADLPVAATASDDQLYKFLGDVWGSMADSWGDKGMTLFTPYYYESGTEQGWAADSDDGLRDLLHATAADDQPSSYPPKGVTEVFNPFLMPMTEHWVHEQGYHFLFVYGENDPWAARKYRVKQGSDNLVYVVADGFHGSKIAALPDAEQKEALAKLSCWMGAPTIPLPKPKPMPFGAAATTFSAEELARGADLIDYGRPTVRRAIP